MYMCVCLYACVNTHATGVWQPEDNFWKSVFSFRHMGSRNQLGGLGTQCLSLHSKHCLTGLEDPRWLLS